MSRIFVRFWHGFWVRRAGPWGWGRYAARMAEWKTRPFHGRAFLAGLDPRGFVAATATLSHTRVRFGRNVYLGDGVVVFRNQEGGAVDFGDRVQVYGNTFIQTGRHACISIGEDTHVQPGCHLSAAVNNIAIGRKVEIAPNCAFYSYDHGTAAGVPIMDQELQSKGGITIGDEAWLGHGVIVLAGVRVGRGAVIGAGSVVARDIPDNAIALGSPARPKRYRTSGVVTTT